MTACPPPDHVAIGRSVEGDDRLRIVIAPSIQDGFFYVVAVFGSDAFGLKKPIAAFLVDEILADILVELGTTPRIEWNHYPVSTEPDLDHLYMDRRWSWPHLVYESKADWMAQRWQVTTDHTVGMVKNHASRGFEPSRPGGSIEPVQHASNKNQELAPLEEVMPTKQNPGGHRGEVLTGQVREHGKNAPVMPTRQPLRDRLVAQTVPFLATLLNCSEDQAWIESITFQVFDDTPTKARNRARIIHGCLDDLAEDLERRNIEGDGIFIAVNQTDLKGREKRNIIGLRSAWADIDFKAASEPFDLAKVPLAPSMAVRSGHGVHLYWVFPEVIPCDAARQAEHEVMLRSIQTTLKPFGADGQVCQVAAVLRLPGFFNMKREPVPVEVIR